MNTYTCGDWAIEKDSHGINHGTSWGLWRGQNLVSTHSTLRAAKAAAADEGCVGEWSRTKVRVEVVGG